MNEQLLDGINGLAGSWSAADSAARFFANDAIYVLAAIAVAFGLLQLRSDWRRAVQIGLAAGLAAALGGAILLAAGGAVTEARPFVHDPDTVLLIHHAADNSFPSDHATLAAVIAVTAAFAWPKWGIGFLALAFVIGFSRVYVGVHYPGDVLVGWAIGSFAAIVAWLVVANAARALPAFRDRFRHAETAP